MIHKALGALQLHQGRSLSFFRENKKTSKMLKSNRFLH